MGEITDVMRRAFADNFVVRSQQLKSRLEAACMPHPGIVGTSKDVDRVGQTTARAKTSRNSDTPLIKTPFDRRRMFLTDYEWADLIDPQDIDKMNDPTSSIITAGVGAMNRSKDDVVIAALRGNAVTVTGAEGSSAVALSNTALPSTQKIAHGSARLTKTKIIQCRQIFLANEAIDGDNPDDALFWAITAAQIADLLGITEAVSADYNTVRPLQDGKIVYWMGFYWLHSERLPKADTTHRYTYAWAKSGMALGTGANLETRLDVRIDKSMAVQPYAKESLGAVRVEEEKVVEVDCVVLTTE